VSVSAQTATEGRFRSKASAAQRSPHEGHASRNLRIKSREVAMLSYLRDIPAHSHSDAIALAIVSTAILIGIFTLLS
jgi:hypothetical protein